MKWSRSVTTKWKRKRNEAKQMKEKKMREKKPQPTTTKMKNDSKNKMMIKTKIKCVCVSQTSNEKLSTNPASGSGYKWVRAYMCEWASEWAVWTLERVLYLRCWYLCAMLLFPVQEHRWMLANRSPNRIWCPNWIGLRGTRCICRLLCRSICCICRWMGVRCQPLVSPGIALASAVFLDRLSFPFRMFF